MTLTELKKTVSFIPENPLILSIFLRYRFQRFALGGVAAKSECTQQVLVVDLWFELNKQRDYASR